MLSLLGLTAALGLLIFLTIRGMSLLIAAPLMGIIIALTSAIPLLPGAGIDISYTETYMAGFNSFVGNWFFMFLLGSTFGKLMEDSGAAHSLSSWISNLIGREHAILAVAITCAVMTYGGVSVFVVAFGAYPIAVSMFKQADLPRRFIPATIAFGSVTFTMTSAGSPEIQNWIPIKYLGTSPYAAWEVSLVVAVFMAVSGYFWLRHMVTKAHANGERFEARDDDPVSEKYGDKKDHSSDPHPVVALLPLLSILTVTFFFHESLKQTALLLALLSGCILAWAISPRAYENLNNTLAQGAMGALIAIANTAAVVGFGSVAKASPAFDLLVNSLHLIPGSPLVAAAVSITTVAAVTGSASGGQAIALPILAPAYLETGADANALHRVVAISSGALDSLPHNGFVVTLIRAICGESHKTAYLPLGAVTVIIPLLGTALATTLLSL